MRRHRNQLSLPVGAAVLSLVGEKVLSTRHGWTGRIDTGDGSSAVTIDASSIRPWTQAEVNAWHRGEGSPKPAVGGGS